MNQTHLPQIYDSTLQPLIHVFLLKDLRQVSEIKIIIKCNYNNKRAHRGVYGMGGGGGMYKS